MLTFASCVILQPIICKCLRLLGIDGRVEVPYTLCYSATPIEGKHRGEEGTTPVTTACPEAGK